MAEAVLSVLLENLDSLIQKEFGLLWGVNKEMDKLSSILSTICAVLEDAEERQLRDRAIKNWLRKLKDVSEELEDLLGECSMEASQMEYKRQRSRSTQKVQASFTSCFNPINTLSRLRIAKRMKNVSERLDEIANERLKFHLHELVHEERSSQIRDMRQTGSIVDQQHVYGREEDKDKIVEFLVDCNSSNCRVLSVYPIVGMGGLGKTTLAQLVFNDERVSRHFDIKIWVCVSEDFDVKRLIKAIIESASGSACDALDMDPLQKRLQNMLERKRFFLVLDDVWNEDHEQWERLKNVVSCGLNGSSIVVTTRLKKVASIMGTIPMHELSLLSKDDCWLMFKQRAFGNESEEQPNLVKIGKEIVRKCGGVPLAAKALGSLMRFKRDEKEWLFVLESELWNLPQDETSILPALRLSYFHLPIELRRCFAFCAVYPKDFEINKQELVHLWMANDLISSKGKMEVEEMGNEACKELYWRSFFQDVKMDESGNIYGFKMHDLVHDLAQCVMEEQCRVVEIDRPINLSRVRHLTCNYSDQPFDLLSAFCKVKSLRTLMLLRKCPYSLKERKFPHCLNFPSLRAFDARNSSLRSISFLISNSKHLRYLNLSNTNIRILPESICLLHCLQTLDISFCRHLRKLPEHMSRLRSLRHFYLTGCNSLRHTPPNVGQLTCLRTLSIFIVDSRRGCHVDELGSLNLGGDLSIKQLQKVKNPIDARKANLAGKTNLKDLRLSWYRNESTAESQRITEQVFEALEPPSTLEILDILNFEGRHFPHWFKKNATVQNIVWIRLNGCKNCLQLPTALGKLPSLTYLELSDMKFVQYVDDETYNNGVQVEGFLRLKTLRISNLPNLEGLSRAERREIFPCLSYLDIYKCPKLTLHCLRSIKELRIRKCTEAILKSVSNLHTLTSLRLSDNDDLASFPHGALQNVTTLQSIHIENFSKLQDLQSDMLVGLSALETFSITSCHMLECFPMGIFRGSNGLTSLDVDDCIQLKSLSDSFGELSALRYLRLTGCPELEAFPNGLNHLASLRNLLWTVTPKLTALPEALQHLPSLEYLNLSDFPNLELLPDWLGNSTSLNSLSIRRCPNLELLPDWLGNLTSLNSLSIRCCPKLASLPTSMQKLTGLQVLEITNCPKLKQRCEKDSGEDWHKIAHIPRVHI